MRGNIDDGKRAGGEEQMRSNRRHMGELLLLFGPVSILGDCPPMFTHHTAAALPRLTLPAAVSLVPASLAPFEPCTPAPAGHWCTHCHF